MEQRNTFDPAEAHGETSKLTPFSKAHKISSCFIFSVLLTVDHQLTYEEGLNNQGVKGLKTV